MTIVPEHSYHATAIETLLDRAFGANRTQKTSYRLREGIEPLAGLSFVYEHGAAVLATIRFWPVTIGTATPGLLLGPLAVDPDWVGRGIGGAMLRRGLTAAAAGGHSIVLLVGDEPYYGRFGFRRSLTRALSLPGPVEPDRFLGLELRPGALNDVSGPVARAVANRSDAVNAA